MGFSIDSSDKILVIAALPEDLAVACGEFISKYKTRIDILCVLQSSENNNLQESRNSSFLKIYNSIGVNKFFIKQLNNDSDFSEQININIKEYDKILIPHKNDNIEEHQFVSNILLKSLLENSGFKEDLQILRYELWNPIKEADYYEDITDFTEDKKRLITAYKTNDGINFANNVLMNNKFRTFTSYLNGSAEYTEAYCTDDLSAYLEKPDIINENTDKEFSDTEIEEFLRSNKAQLKIDKLAERYAGKKIVLFGAGDYARCIFKNYDLSKLNIISVCDKRFEQNRIHEFYNLECVRPENLKDVGTDVILIAEQKFVENYYILVNRLKISSDIEIGALIPTELNDFVAGDLKNKICTRPFHVLSIVPTGDCVTCCPAYIKNFTIGNVFKEDFESLWRGRRANNLRNALIHDDYTTCDLNTCINIELSDKNALNKYYESDGETVKMPDTILMSWDFDCNAACITCRNEIIKNDDETLKSLQSIEHSVLEACKNAKLFYASGNGDPFGSRYARDIIKKVININPQIRFLIHTNGILCNKKICDELNITDKIKDITFSIHASCKETYNKVVRYGNFEKVLENLEWISSLKQEGKIENINMVFVVHKLNYKDMPDFVKMAENYNALASFRYYRQWAHNTEFKYKDMAVFEPEHPEYPELVKILQDSVFDSSHCSLDPKLKSIRNSY